MRMIVFLLFGMGLVACSGTKEAANLTTMKIQTSAQCDMCKLTIEDALKGMDGLYKADLDVTTQKLLVKYDPAKVNLGDIRQRVSAAGYDADEVAAEKSAYDALPACCKKGGHGK
jgi:mercuric ion binding protein